MIRVEKFNSLPETIESGELRKLFADLIDYSITNKGDTIVVLRLLSELSDKQWHNYERIDSETGDLIANWLIAHRDLESLEFVRLSISICVMLGLRKVLFDLKSHLNEPLNTEILRIISEFVDTHEASIDDPYLGMRGINH